MYGIERNTNTYNGVLIYSVLETYKMEGESNSSEETERWIEGEIVKKRRRESKFCDHCNQFVSKSTFYRHCLEYKSTTQLPISPSESLVETATVVDESIFAEPSSDRSGKAIARPRALSTHFNQSEPNSHLLYN